MLLKVWLIFSGIPRDHDQSYHTFMWENFFKHIDINPANAHILNGNAPNLEVECQQYEEKIKEAGGIELFMGGKYDCKKLMLLKCFTEVLISLFNHLWG